MEVLTLTQVVKTDRNHVARLNIVKFEAKENDSYESMIPGRNWTSNNEQDIHLSILKQSYRHQLDMLGKDSQGSARIVSSPAYMLGLDAFD